MSPRAFLILAGLTVLAVIGAAIAILSEQDLSARELAGGELLLSDLNARAEDVNQIIVETTRYRLVLERRGDDWVAADRRDYPVKAGTPQKIISSLTAMAEIDAKTENPDWYQYIEVTGPAAANNPSGIRLVAKSTDGKTLADVIVGKQSNSIGATRIGGTFVRPSDQAQSWLVEGVVDVPLSLQGWFDPVLNVPGPEVFRIAVLKGNDTVFDATKPAPDSGNYALTYLSDSVGPAGSTPNGDNIRGMSGAIVSVLFQDVRPLDQFQVPADARTVRYVTKDGLQIDATLGQVDGETWVRFVASAADGSKAAEAAAAIKARTDNWVFKLPENRMAILGRDLAALIFRPGESPEGAPSPSVPIPASPPFPSVPIPAPSGQIQAPFGPIPTP